MKPKIFIGSSVEALDVAYAAQEDLEHVCEATVWSQGIFQLSKYTMEDLVVAAEETDFALFVFSLDDVSNIRGEELKTVRDNVIFEMGLFIGSIGRDRCFMLTPRGVEDLHFPTDLLGMTPGTYEPERNDKNLVAAVGPAVNRIRRTVLRLGTRQAQVTKEAVAIVEQNREATEELISDGNDVISILQSWWGSQTSYQNKQPITFRSIDKKFGFEAGMTAKYIEEAVFKWGYVVERRGKETILFTNT